MVALLTESVDRNAQIAVAVAACRVALLTESVDRNINRRIVVQYQLRSLSSRRAWIEIAQYRLYSARWPVALLTESVDRNFPLLVRKHWT